jgi:hypothetical protein
VVRFLSQQLFAEVFEYFFQLLVFLDHLGIKVDNTGLVFSCCCLKLDETCIITGFQVNLVPLISFGQLTVGCIERFFMSDLNSSQLLTLLLL